MNLVVREMIMIIILKECFSIFLNGFVFLSELDKPNEFEKSWARMTILFVLARRLILMHRKSWMYVLVIPCRMRAVINFELL